MSTTLFTNARLVLDDADQLTEPRQVVVDGNLISHVGASGHAPAADRVIDVHAHITGLSLSPRNVPAGPNERESAATDYLHAALMDGFTTVREAGGADHRVARALEQGSIVGPRLFYSGRALTQTGGGADFRTMEESVDPCGHVTPYSVMSVIVDGVDEARNCGSAQRN
jgi:imidazolonepropionase-like amidohydrolase